MSKKTFKKWLYENKEGIGLGGGIGFYLAYTHIYLGRLQFLSVITPNNTLLTTLILVLVCAYIGAKIDEKLPEGWYRSFGIKRR